jgi:hypothetical protein
MMGGILLRQYPLRRMRVRVLRGGCRGAPAVCAARPWRARSSWRLRLTRSPSLLPHAQAVLDAWRAHVQARQAARTAALARADGAYADLARGGVGRAALAFWRAWAAARRAQRLGAPAPPLPLPPPPGFDEWVERRHCRVLAEQHAASRAPLRARACLGA